MLRKAKLQDAESIHRLIMAYARRKLLLPRSLSEICENIRDFFIHEENGIVTGCGALHMVWKDLAEIKSLAVEEGFHGRGIGTQIAEACLEEARELSVPRVFVLSYRPEFFERMGFRRVPKEKFPQKIWNECVKCPDFPDCKEVALEIAFKTETP